jgi:hypothetical protein
MPDNMIPEEVPRLIKTSTYIGEDRRNMPAELREWMSEVRQYKQKVESFFNTVSRIYDIDPNKPDDRAVIIQLRESIGWTIKMSSRMDELNEMFKLHKRLMDMKDPTFDEMLIHIKDDIRADEGRMKIIMSYVRLIIATALGVISTVIAGKLGVHSP